jgi:predicted nucleic acid-binding Zn ribbon protein
LGVEGILNPAMPFQPPGDCPVCGEPVRAGRKCCAQCGSDERSGWNDTTHCDALDLPSEDFNYDDFVKEKFGKGGRRTRPSFIWWITGIVMLVVLIWIFVGGHF